MAHEPRTQLVLALALCISLAGAQQRAQADRRAPNGAVASAEGEFPAYRIGPGDVLQIDVWKEPDASNPSVTVRPDGRVSLAMVGEIAVAGLTPVELEARLADKFGTLIRNPRVTVAVRDANSQKIYVLGEVRREGSIRMAGPMTVLQALAEAGGVNDYAKRKQIYILRVMNGRQARLPFDYEAVLRGQKAEQNLRLQPGDTVVVPR
jgi:polysaccharide export outer membrane protein